MMQQTEKKWEDVASIKQKQLAMKKKWGETSRELKSS